MTIQEIYDIFIKQCNDSEKAIKEVIKVEYSTNDTLLLIRELTIKQAFINVFSGWEHFLENTMIAYALDEPSLTESKPLRYISPIDEEHADKIIKGNSSYPDWSNLQQVKDMADRLFENGKPYVTALNGFNSVFTGIKRTRNIIVHDSIKSKNEFNTLVRTSLNASSVGISPTDYLLSKKGSQPRFYKLYIEHLKNAASIICNYSSGNETNQTTDDSQ